MKTYPSQFGTLGTKVADPLVRYSEYSGNPYKPCHKCGVHFTTLGLARHVSTHKKRKK